MPLNYTLKNYYYGTFPVYLTRIKKIGLQVLETVLYRAVISACLFSLKHRQLLFWTVLAFQGCLDRLKVSPQSTGQLCYPSSMRKTGLPGDSVVKNLSAHAGDMFDPQVRKIPWRREWPPTPVFLSGKSYGQRSLVETVHGVAKDWATKQYVRKITSSSRTKVDRFTWSPLIEEVS